MKPSFLQKLFCRIPELEGERILLRRIRHADAEDMYEYSRLEEVTRYLLWSPHPNPEHTKNYIAYLQSEYRDGRLYDWAIVLKESGKMIGTVGFPTIRATDSAAEIGYVLNPAYHHRGYAREAVRLIIDFAFQKLALHRIEARCFRENDASRRLLLDLGFRFEGRARDGLRIKGKFETIDSFAILTDDWSHFKGRLS